ncbi:MAG TPA: SpvB/TcaC N-terminal domain-containing protein, partial [Bacteroidales bacterium]|nr:SpvB/TcaC N-terminal domain-containing protein [Bacteroidales bacterium]
MINGIITIPESPQTSGFVPTSVNDIRVAEPSAGITLIEPPVANNEGDASLSFPLKIPAGRTGLQPQLLLMYSSDMGSGWLGYGWDITVPAISVDITWGVPRYLSDRESETYLLQGSQLTPVAHRGDYIDRGPEKRFYSRRESDFSRIIRHGDHPSNYWWEVTTKDGVRNFYGGTPSGGIAENAVSMDQNGNIGYWALVETRDLDDNFVSYKYDKPAESGQETYIREISYTGHGAEEGAYKISFLKLDEENNFERKDFRIDARYGFIKRDNQLLRRINITYNEEPVRSYTFHYKAGEFMKSLLSDVTEINSAGERFYSHRFSYYNDVQSGGIYVPYGPEMTKILPDDKLKEPLLNPVNFFFDNVSALGGSASMGFSGGTSVTVGLLDGNLATKDNTAGGNFSYQSSDNEAFLSFIDLNGDGLPDKVYKKNNKVYYRPNLLSYPNDNVFGAEKLIDGISRIGYSKTSGFSGGIEANPFQAFAGSDFGSTTTKTSVYFTDFNGDGLIDLASDGAVYFNHLENGVPVFSESSSTTPNPVYASSEIAPDILPDPAEEQAQLEAQFPLHDAVRLWKAPFEGSVIINAPVQLVKDTSQEAKSDKYRDGVKVSIQQNGNNPLWMAVIDSGNYSILPGPLPVPVNVNKGDRLYFRVQSRFNGSSDKVYWDPEIQYLTINNSDTLVNHKDSNRKIVGRYKASEDYVLCGQQSVGLPKDGQLRITASFSKEVTSDSLELFINYTDSSGHKSVIYHSLYTCEAKDNDPIDIYYDIIRNGFVQFSIVSSTSIDWSAIRFSPVIEYTRIDNDSIPVIGPDGKPVLRFAAIPEFVKMYNDPVRQELPVIVDKSFIKSFDPDSIDVGLYKIKITPGLTSISNVDPARTVNVILAVKQRDKILGEKEYQYLNGSLLAHDTLIATIQRGDTLFLEYYFPDNGLLTSADTTYIVIGPDSENLLKASAFSPGDTRDGIFGSMYRGWGQFDYKGDSFRVSSPIDEALLKMRDYSGVNISADTSALGNILNPIGEVFNIMIPYAETGYYRGTDNEVFVSGKYVSSSRLGENNVLVEPLVFPASGLGSVTKILKNSSTSVGGGLSFASISHTWGNDNITLDMIDMNGDMYPDLLSTNSIQYTDVRGVLSGPAVNHGIGDHYSKSEATGVTGGGNFANAKAANSLTPVTARGTKANTRNNFKTNNNAREAQESSLAAAGSIGVTSGEDHTDQTWLDINGDGLPDKVYNNGQVRLNLGYSFAPAETWNFDAICTGKSIDLSGGLGINIANGSIAAGVSISKSFNYATETFLDINADRLPDLVKGDQVYFNTGAGFASAVDWSGFSGSWPGSLPVQLVGAIPLEAGESIGEAANGGFTVGIGIPIIMIKICINPSASVNHGISRTLTQLADIDGDGMPDILSSGSEVNMKVKPSTIFRTNILKTVERPLGGSFTLDYLVTPAVYDHPGGKLALASVRVFDGLRGDGVDTTFTTFGYEGGYYDRHERQFLGFSEVSTNMCHAGENNSIYRTLIQSYSNRDYYSKGKMLSETLVDGSGNKQKGSENFYSLRDIHTGAPVPESDREPAFIALSETKKYTFEGSSGPRIITRETFEYDTLGNITVYTDSSGNANDLYTVSVKYHAIPELYVYCIPSLQEVITSEGLKRKSETFVNENGDITRISRYITGDRAAWFDLEYDEFGNLAKITRPANHKGERMWYKYEYDNAIHTYISRVTDAYGYTSSSLHDYRWGLPVENTDMNNQKIKYSHDEAGRLDTVTGPFELASGKPYTIAFEYFTDADVPYAHTMHYDSIYDSDIETYSFSDGFGRLVQTKKTALIFDNPNTEDKNGFIVSGKVMYDAFRRPVSSYQPVFEPAGNPEKYNSNPDIVNPTLLEYDVQDRIKRVTLPDGANMTHGYNVGYY